MDSTADILNPTEAKVTINGKTYVIKEPTLAQLRKFQNLYEKITTSVSSILEALEEKRMTLHNKINANQKDNKELDPEVAKQLSKELMELYKENMRVNKEISNKFLDEEFDLYNIMIEPNFTKEDYLNLTPSMKKILDAKILEISHLVDFFAGNVSLVTKITNLIASNQLQQ